MLYCKDRSFINKIPAPQDSTSLTTCIRLHMLSFGPFLPSVVTTCFVHCQEPSRRFDAAYLKRSNNFKLSCTENSACTQFSLMNFTADVFLDILVGM